MLTGALEIFTNAATAAFLVASRTVVLSEINSEK
jgi:hypothetical protein